MKQLLSFPSGTNPLNDRPLSHERRLRLYRATYWSGLCLRSAAVALISSAADGRKRMSRNASNRTVSEHQQFDDFDDGDWPAFDSSRSFDRRLPRVELGVRDKHKGGIGTGLCPLGKLAKTGCSLLLNLPVLCQCEPVCLEDADGVAGRR